MPNAKELPAKCCRSKHGISMLRNTCKIAKILELCNGSRRKIIENMYSQLPEGSTEQMDEKYVDFNAMLRC